MSARRDAVLFLDASGQGFTRNLAALRDQLLRERPQSPLRYFFADLESNAVPEDERRLTRRLLRKMTADSGWVITATESEQARRSRFAAGRRRVLILSPRLALVDETAAVPAPVPGYTDVIVAGSAFAATAQARFPGSQVHALGLPVFAELVSADVRDRARAQLATLCPGSAGKRVVVITAKRTPEQIFGRTSAAELVTHLPQDVFLILDVPGVLPTLEAEPAQLAERLFVNDGTFGLFSLLALGDELLTSKFRDAVYFSVTGRTLRFLNSEKNVGTLGDRLPDEYSGLGIPDIADLSEAMKLPYDETARLQFQSVYAVEDPARSASAIVNALF